MICGLRARASDWVRPASTLFSAFVVSTGEVVGTGLLVLAVGAAVGAVGAGVAVTRFLDV